MKKWISLVLAMCLLLCGCGKAEEAETSQNTTETTSQAAGQTPKPLLVGLCLPSTEGQWRQRAEDLQKGLEGSGFAVELADAQGKILTQVDQVKDLVGRADCLIVAALDSAALALPLEEAKKQGLPVISYDNLLMDTGAAVYHISFDYDKMGAYAAARLAEDAGLQSITEPLAVELFMGAAENRGSILYYQGIMSVLEDYLEQGKLTIPSGRRSFEDTAVSGGTEQMAYDIMTRYLQDYYPETLPHALFTGTEEIARGCIRALEESPLLTEKNFPMIFSQGADTPQGENSKLYASVWKDYSMANQACISAVAALLAEKTPETNASQTKNNVAQVPTYLCRYLQVEEEKPKPEE